ncbi:flavodoxin family protein [Nocardia cyriacigeorgica]|uniref:Flavodoxin n=1 Tax=Nocardia cyriacigeorgica TaxID=135487 RepID=A0A4U8W221_9NOCA|nr:flavodoxin family protein [Nocardia cyriacigeorgica]MBF6160777.1 flavodoxin family protein [Nocardia cyriacigeorgica]MBF6201639.1 flavodoxin family protein [Nocardia cyriacigeorgica]MBF6344189.1 flavodoxin family protein [Nocardia cyriacigeorgica]MBF6395481.1 flavodoxin family protein [Nocardia cyriacigeorgica]MBF6401113.1 flavodoxin family protein [Nocardia cyriacigeorgica]
MKAIIVCASVSHGNTERVAEAMAEVLPARVVGPHQVDASELATYDLVGFGSGVRYLDLYPELRAFVASLPPRQRAKAFVFATSGLPEPPFRRYLHRLTETLEQKGFDVVDTFTCRGFDTWLPLRIVGGIQKGHPDDDDLRAARTFAETLRARVETA